MRTARRHFRHQMQSMCTRNRRHETPSVLRRHLRRRVPNIVTCPLYNHLRLRSDLLQLDLNSSLFSFNQKTKSIYKYNIWVVLLIYITAALDVLIMNMSGQLILNVLIMNIISEEECTLDWSQMIGTCLFYPRGECRGGGRVRDMGCIYSTCDVSVNRNII